MVEREKEQTKARQLASQPANERQELCVARFSLRRLPVPTPTQGQEPKSQPSVQPDRPKAIVNPVTALVGRGGKEGGS